MSREACGKTPGKYVRRQVAVRLFLDDKPGMAKLISKTIKTTIPLEIGNKKLAPE